MQQSRLECSSKKGKTGGVNISEWSVEEFFRHFQPDVVAVTDLFYNANEDYVSIEDLMSEAYIVLAEYYNSGRLKNCKRPSDIRQRIQRTIVSRIREYCESECRERLAATRDTMRVNAVYSDDYLVLGFISDDIQQAVDARLDEKRRLAFTMYNDGYVYDEIGKALHVTRARVGELVNDSFKILASSRQLRSYMDMM